MIIGTNSEMHGTYANYPLFPYPLPGKVRPHRQKPRAKETQNRGMEQGPGYHGRGERPQDGCWEIDLRTDGVCMWCIDKNTLMDSLSVLEELTFISL